MNIVLIKKNKNKTNIHYYFQIKSRCTSTYCNSETGSFAHVRQLTHKQERERERERENRETERDGEIGRERERERETERERERERENEMKGEESRYLIT